MQLVRNHCDCCLQLLVHGFHGLRDHPGFLGPLPLSQQLKSRPFTPVNAEERLFSCLLSIENATDIHEIVRSLEECYELEAVFTALPPRKFAIDIARCLFLHQGRTLIVRFLSSCNCNFNFCFSVVEIELQRNKCDT